MLNLVSKSFYKFALSKHIVSFTLQIEFVGIWSFKNGLWLFGLPIPVSEVKWIKEIKSIQTSEVHIVCDTVCHAQCAYACCAYKRSTHAHNCNCVLYYNAISALAVFIFYSTCTVLAWKLGSVINFMHVHINVNLH